MDLFMGQEPAHPDVTKNRQAGKAAGDGEEKFRRLVENINDWVWEVDEKCVYTYASPQIAGLLGYTPEEVLGKTPFDFMPEDEAERIWSTFDRIARKMEPFSLLENVLVKKDGSRITVETSGVPVFDEHGALAGYSGVDRDISRRKKAEEEVRKLSRVVEESPSTIVITDRNGNIEYVNPTFTRLTGYTFEEAKGKNPRILKSDHMTPEEYKQLWDTILAGKDWRGEFLNRKKNGEMYWEYAVIAPLTDASGHITNFIAIKEDISERKKAEEELATSKARADLYLDLMGHDIKNMNMLASSFLEIALETLLSTGRLDSKDAQMLEKPLESLQNSTNLINTIQRLQRSLTGEHKLEKTEVSDAIRNAAENFSSVPGREVRIDLTLKCPCTALADDLLKDVFVNLIGNAVKHSGPDTPLTVKILLNKTAGEGKEWCRTIVEDDGPGIPDSTKERLFRRFSRGQTRAPGTGLGLYIVSTLVDHYGGRIAVEDRVPGDYTRGTRFIIDLPAA